MTMIPTLSGSGLLTWLGNIRPYTDVQPFTYRDGATYQEILETIRDYIENTLVPYVTDGFAQINVRDIIEAVLTAVADKDVVLTDEQIHSVLNQAGSDVVTKLNSMYVTSEAFSGVKRFYAPDPNGVDDTATLKAIFDSLMTSNGILDASIGEIVLGPGIYKGNWSLNAGFWSGKIKGRGKQATYLQSLDETKAVFRQNGASGSIESGALEDLTIVGLSLDSAAAHRGIGTELNGIGGFQIERVQYINLAKGHRWIITDTVDGQFTEFCVLRDINMYYCDLPLEYSGAGSYHGSGVDGNSVIGLDPEHAMMEIGAGCNVYNAPLSLTLFTSGGTGNAIVNRYAGPVYFYGNFRMELQNTDYYDLAWRGGAYVYYSGSLNIWGGACRLGQLYLVEKVVSTGTLHIPYLKPWNAKQTLNPGATPIMGGAPILGPGTYDASVEVFGPNGYWYSYTLRCWTSGTSIPATVDIVKTHYANDPNNAGAPTFSWQDGLIINNPNFTNSYFTSSSFSCKVHMNPGDNLGQF